MPISVVYPHNRHLSPKVRAFTDWAAELFSRCPLLSGRSDMVDSECTWAGEKAAQKQTADRSAPARAGAAAAPAAAAAAAREEPARVAHGGLAPQLPA
jgi:LysR family transcriptional regulator for bpeEF and oprC